MSRTWLVVGVSGPDGAGKSTLVRTLEQRFAEAGHPTSRTYAYGCVVCRHVPVRRRATTRPSTVGSPVRERRRSPFREWTYLVLAGLRVGHGLIDAGELALRLRLPRRHVNATRNRPGRAQRATGIALTDRSSLDGLAKFSPERGSMLDRVYRRIGQSYGVVLLLEAPVSALVERDRDHSAPALAAMTEQFAALAKRLDNIVLIDTELRSPTEVANAAEWVIRSRLPTGA